MDLAHTCEHVLGHCYRLIFLVIVLLRDCSFYILLKRPKIFQFLPFEKLFTFFNPSFFYYFDSILSFDQYYVSQVSFHGDLNLTNMYREIQSLVSLVPVPENYFDNRGAVCDSLGLLSQDCLDVVVGLHFHENALIPKQIVQACRLKLAVHQTLYHLLELFFIHVSTFSSDHALHIPVEDAELLPKVGVENPHMVAIFSHAHSVQHSEVPDLVVADTINKCKCEFLLIGLNASDEVHVGVERHLVHQGSNLLTNLEPQEFFSVLRLQ